MYCSLRLHVFVVNLNMYGCLLITSIWMVVVSADNIHWSACKVHCSRKGIQLSVHPWSCVRTVTVKRLMPNIAGYGYLLFDSSLRWLYIQMRNLA